MVAGLRPGARIVLGCVGAMALRVIVVLINVLTTGGQGAWHVQARLSSVAILMVGVGVLVGVRLASRRGEWRDLPAAGFAGGALGLLAAAVGFAVIQSAERVLGSRSSSFWAVVLLWGAIGALLGLGLDSLDSSPVERSGDRAMIARGRALAWSALVLLATAGTAHGQRQSPADQEIARGNRPRRRFPQRRTGSRWVLG